MAEFDSPLGKKQFQGSSRVVYNIPDEEKADGPAPSSQFVSTNFPDMQPGVPVELTPAQFQEMQQRRVALKSAQGKSSGEARQRVDLLVGIGRLTKDVVIEGHVFSLQSLKSKEMRETIRAVSQSADGADSMFEMRAQLLARSLVKIDGHPVSIVLGNDSLEAKLMFIDDSEEHIVNTLYAGYTEMTKKNEMLIKSTDDAKGIVEEIKK